VAVDYHNAETLRRVQAWLAMPLMKKRHPDGLAELAAVYALASGQPTSHCRQCHYSDYVAVIKAYERHSLRLLHPQTMPPSTYTLAPGFENETFVHESYSEAVTADTLTDAAAEFFIQNGYQHAFLKAGKPLEEEAPAEPKRLLKADHQARYKELFGQEPDARLTVDELLKANDAKQAELDAQRD
jgi:hypothetical protein